MSDTATENRVVERIYDKIDGISETVTAVKVSIATINTKLEAMHNEPCGKLNEHLDEHKKVNNSWRDKIIGAVVDVAKLAAIGLVMYFIARQGVPPCPPTPTNAQPAKQQSKLPNPCPEQARSNSVTMMPLY